MGGPKNNPAQADVLVIGGGPAGMFAAAAAVMSGAKVTLLEKNDRLGRKMSITGGGRGNLTNTASLHDFINNVPGNGSFLFSALTRFSSADCRKFFKNLGVPTKEEECGRVFPVRERAGEVVDTLAEYLAASGVQVIYQVRAAGLLLANRRCQGIITGGRRVFSGKTVVIATGGASYPQTGSTGDGYLLASQAGHQVAPRHPGLVPLCLAEQHLCRHLQGLSITDASLTLATAAGKTIAAERGDVLFTHFGISGPAALRLSRAVAPKTAAAGAGGLRLLMDVLPDISEENLAASLLSMAAEQPRKAVINIIKQILPGRLAAACAKMLQGSEHQKSGETSKGAWREAARLFKNLPFTVTGTRPLAEAMITIGGVSVREIDPRTMASHLVDGLYFAGEVIDVDAHTGGYNMQVAFSTGWSAGLAAAEEAGFPAAAIPR
ncbi:NAD(P)/FAD-dependent oxidoreductase [Pelotomaculum terephthalicicum JT]|uniref:NAD(P)/FAD-dependent oxidoreductase n=1 Tax=Pelotomaculum terephthalicicum TaxID=206393 RepID=UPI001F03A230|nr:NAD(P)/FAD-dependent oxidoreductase [Pelotomaculum terephthalicicum]MCG9968313.1 NAD(P)/FAD-dependent oxidoreductase [Pelotomaculum terephthalicicum JT]